MNPKFKVSPRYLKWIFQLREQIETLDNKHRLKQLRKISNKNIKEQNINDWYQYTQAGTKRNGDLHRKNKKHSYY